MAFHPEGAPNRDPAGRGPPNHHRAGEAVRLDEAVAGLSGDRSPL